MRIFVTGASGWIGSSVVPELIGAGHNVVGLARSDAAATAIAQSGAEVVRGALTDLDVLRSTAASSDAVIHLAYDHGLGQIGGAPVDATAIDTFTTVLEDTGKRLLITGATIAVPGRVATERDELVPRGPIAARIQNMRTALEAADRGIRVSLVMIPRSVHGEGERHGFIPQLVARARDVGVSAYAGDGSARWPAVHVKDAATLYRLAIEKAPAGSILNAVGDEGVFVKDIAQAIGRGLHLPVAPRPAEEFGMPLSALFSQDMPASSAATQQLLGWTPTHAGLIEDINLGHYFN